MVLARERRLHPRSKPKQYRLTRKAANTKKKSGGSVVGAVTSGLGLVAAGAAGYGIRSVQDILAAHGLPSGPTLGPTPMPASGAQTGVTYTYNPNSGGYVQQGPASMSPPTMISQPIPLGNPGIINPDEAQALAAVAFPGTGGYQVTTGDTGQVLNLSPADLAEISAATGGQ